MIVMTVTALLSIIAVATGIALVDNWIRGGQAFAEITEERALAQAGFVPVIEATQLRQRPVSPARYPRGRAGVSPAFTKRASRAPRRAIAPLGEALGVA
ncbi:MAG: hypothetical protein AAGL10_13460 [Pseudomonadota bacterium]